MTGLPFVVRWRRAVLAADPLEVPMPARAVAFVLGQHFGGGVEPTCWLLVGTIAREAACSERGARIALARLVAAGFLEAHRRGPKASVYSARLPKERHEVPAKARGRSQDRHEVPPRPARGAAQDRHEVPIEVDPRTRPGSRTTARLAPRSRDELFEAVAEVCGIDWRSDLTRAARGSLNRAVADLRAVGAEPAEVRRRAANWPYDTTLTPPAFAKHWPQLAAGHRAPETQAMRLIRGGEP